jgi:hypothetical protein
MQSLCCSDYHGRSIKDFMIINYHDTSPIWLMWQNIYEEREKKVSLYVGGVSSPWACLDGGVSVSLKQTNTKTNTFHPNTCVSLVLVGTNTPKNKHLEEVVICVSLVDPTTFLSPSPFSNDWKSYFKCKLTPPSKHPRC